MRVTWAGVISWPSPAHFRNAPLTAFSPSFSSSPCLGGDAQENEGEKNKLRGIEGFAEIKENDGGCGGGRGGGGDGDG